jgi:ABC-type multidrug transport system fused ATPase/permease subunit
MEILWFIIISFALIAYLMVFFHIITDLFRDKSISGWIKAVWMICLVIFPLITAVVYLLARGRGMSERQMEAYGRAQEAQEDYIRSVASTSPVEQIKQAEQMLSSGTITQAEFDALKAKALA